MCCDCKALMENDEMSKWQRCSLWMQECTERSERMYIQYVHKDVFLAGVIRWMNADMRSDLHGSF